MKNMNRPAPLCGVSCKLTRRPCKTVQSTHPRGVRHLFEHGHQLRQIISTHAPREGCDAGAEGGKQVGVDISIHAPREGCDGMMIATTMQSARFQSTHPARGATPHVGQRPVQQAISIHAPREGCDRLYLMALFGTYNNFNPRTPRGVRRPAAWFKIGTGPFQSTHPARGATCKLGGGRKMTPNISIHAPREGCDRLLWMLLLPTQISIHAPREGCDGQRVCIWGYPKDFNPRTPRGVRPPGSTPSGSSIYFNPRTPRGVRQQTLPKSREFAWLNSLICTRGRRLSIQKQTRLCSIKLSFMLFGCEPAGEGVSSWTSHATKSKVRLEGRSAYSQSVRSSAHSDFPRNKSGDCPVRGP